MSYTKLQFVSTAFEEIGQAEYEFDLSPEMANSGLRRLDALMAEWNGKGIRLGYPLSPDPQNSDIDTPTVVPNWAWSAVYLNLAIDLCAMVGKTVPDSLKGRALQAYSSMVARMVRPPQMQMPASMPSGAGSRWRGPGQNYVVPPSLNAVPLPEDDVSFGN